MKKGQRRWSVWITDADGSERLLKKGISTNHQARQVGAAYRRRHPQCTWRVG
jgi:hypothetical protein